MIYTKTKSALPIFLFAAMLCALQAIAQNNPYRRPPADVASIVEARPTPLVSMNPTRDALLLTDYNPNPGIATLAQPFLKLAGQRVNPQINARQRITEFTGCTVNWFSEGKNIVVEMPANGRMAGVPSWSPDGKRIAFGVDVADGVQLWVADARTGKSKRLGSLLLNDVLSNAFYWLKDSERLLVRCIPSGRGPAPSATVVPSGPSIEETSGKVSQVMTYQDLLKNEHDEFLFEYYATSQLMVVNASSGKAALLGSPGLYTGVDWSPDENYVLVTQLRKPFSYRVQFSNFARKTEIWDRNGKSIRTLVEFPVTDEIPRQGTVVGPRAFDWQPIHGARLLWAEALDGGDPKRKVDYRDKVMLLDAPFSGEARELLKTKHRYSGFDWLAAKDAGLLSEFDRDRRWYTTYVVDLQNPSMQDTLFDLSVNDDYANPGNPVLDRLPNGDWVIAQEGDWLYYDSEGASEAGSYPRLDKINLKTREKQTVYQSANNTFEEFIAFAGKGRDQILTRYQSKTEVPNFYLVNIKNKARSPSPNSRIPPRNLRAFKSK